MADKSKEIKLVKPNHYLWFIPLLALGIGLLLSGFALASPDTQTADMTPTPTPRPLYPDDVVVPKTHFPGLIAGAVVILIIIMVGVLVRPRK